MRLVDELELDYANGFEYQTRGLQPFLFGPPGEGKSAAAHELAERLNSSGTLSRPVRVFEFNASRISPFELEGIQTITDGVVSRAQSEYFSEPQAGDIIEWTEFSRADVMVQAGLMDVWASGRMLGKSLPWTFNIATANDRRFKTSAMKNRFKVYTSPDPRTDQREKLLIARLIVAKTGLHPEMATHFSMLEYVENQIGESFVGFGITDDGAEVAPASYHNVSTRSTIGIIQQHDLNPNLTQVMVYNNDLALAQGHPEHYYLDRKRKKKDIDSHWLSVLPQIQAKLPYYDAPVKALVRSNIATLTLMERNPA